MAQGDCRIADLALLSRRAARFPSATFRNGVFAAMNVFITIVVPLALAAVALVLLLGLINLIGGNSPRRAQNLMRWRVVLQAVAIIVVMITIYLLGR